MQIFVERKLKSVVDDHHFSNNKIAPLYNTCMYGRGCQKTTVFMNNLFLRDYSAKAVTFWEIRVLKTATLSEISAKSVKPPLSERSECWNNHFLRDKLLKQLRPKTSKRSECKNFLRDQSAKKKYFKSAETSMSNGLLKKNLDLGTLWIGFWLPGLLHFIFWFCLIPRESKSWLWLCTIHKAAGSAEGSGSNECTGNNGWVTDTPEDVLFLFRYKQVNDCMVHSTDWGSGVLDQWHSWLNNNKSS